MADFVEVERVEILRGPQGTLFGRNATGGLINIITPDPKFDFSGVVKADYTFFHGTGEYRTQAYVTGPITSTLAGDLALNFRQNGRYIKDLVRGGKIGFGKSFAGRGKLLFRPSDKVQMVLTLSHLQRFTNEDNASLAYKNNSIANRVPGAIVTSRPYTAALTLLPTSDAGIGLPENDSRIDQVALRNRIDLGFATLESVHNFAKSRTFQGGETDSASPMISSNSLVYKNKYFSNEVRLLSNGDGPLSWIAGVYQFHLDAKAPIYVYSGVAPTYATFVTTKFDPALVTKAHAVFGEGSYDITNQLSVTVGARYSSEWRQLIQTLNNTRLFKINTGWRNKWTYRGSVLYKVTDNTNIYASYGTGFKSGVYSGTQTSATVAATNPETVKQIEFGVKAQPTPWLRTNVSVFRSKYENLQVGARSPVDGTFLTYNAAGSTIKGGELEVDAFVTDDLSLRAGVSILSAKFTSFPLAQIFVPVANPPNTGNTSTSADMKGRYLVRAPRYTVSLGGNWKHELAGGTFSISANVYRSAKVYYEFSNRLYQPSYTTLAGEIAWTTPNEKLKFKIAGTNLTDELIAQNIQAGPAGDRVAYERPRQVMVGVEARF